MTYAPGYPPARRPASGIDIAMSILALLLALGGGAVAAFFGIFFMAFTDHCPPETCHIDAGVTAMFIGFGAWRTVRQVRAGASQPSSEAGAPR